MTREQLEDVRDTNPIENLITANDLKNKEDRVLISGYTCDRTTFITELKQGKIVTYLADSLYKKGKVYKRNTYLEIEENSDYIPNKRVYPHKSDYEFCKLLEERGVGITFGTYQE
jgi:hypothetical protein